MGLCYSLRSRLAAARPSVPYGGRGEADPPPVTAEHGDPQVRHRLRQDLVAKERADKKRSKSIDKTLKAEKREYKQTHRLLLLGLPVITRYYKNTWTWESAASIRWVLSIADMTILLWTPGGGMLIMGLSS